MAIYKGNICLKDNNLHGNIVLYEEIWGYPKTFKAFQKIKPIRLVPSMYLAYKSIDPYKLSHSIATLIKNV